MKAIWLHTISSALLDKVCLFIGDVKADWADRTPTQFLLQSFATIQYLCGELLVLLGQDPGTRIEVVLFWEQLLHSPHCPAHVDLPQHFNHPCNAQSTVSEIQ